MSRIPITLPVMPPLTLRKLGTATFTTMLAVVVVGCHKAKPDPAAPPPQLHPLSGIVGQALIVAPVQALRVAAELAWTGLPRSAAVTMGLDSAIAVVLKERVANTEWAYFDALAKSYANNPTYATDPRALAVNPLRAASLKVEQRLPEPIASQLRTMIALQSGRLVLIPVELRFDRTPAGLGRPVVRLVLIDPRSSVVRWIGEVIGTDSPGFPSAYTALSADRIADLFVAK